MDISGKNSALLLQLMNASLLRARVLAANLANQNTPGYQRREVRFEEALATELAKSRPNLTRIAPEVRVDETAEAKADGNTVSMEKEVSAGLENRLLFELYASIKKGRSRLTEIAIRSER